MNDYFIFLVLWCAVQAGVVVHGGIAMANSNPVRVGGTATFSCHFLSLNLDKVDRIFWSANEPTLDLVLILDLGNSCRVEKIAPSLAHYAFDYTCRSSTFTLSILNVTENDIKVNNTWCCEIQHGSYWFDGYVCSHIVKADSEPTTEIHNQGDLNATLQTTSTSSFLDTRTNAENYTPTRTVFLAALNGSDSRPELPSAQYWGLLLVLSRCLVLE